MVSIHRLVWALLGAHLCLNLSACSDAEKEPQTQPNNNGRMIQTAPNLAEPKLRRKFSATFFDPVLSGSDASVSPRAFRREPKVFLIHGIGDPEAMENLESFIKSETQITDVTIYHHSPLISPPKTLARLALNAHQSDQAFILIGHSQGGFQVIKVAREMIGLGDTADLVVSIAAGGAGRTVPDQIGFDPRPIPSGVIRYLNFFGEGDALGTDAIRGLNDAKPETPLQKPIPEITNTFVRGPGVGHWSLPRCTGGAPTAIRTQVCDLILKEIKKVRPQASR